MTYRYGCTNRPPGYAQVPGGYVATEPHPDFNHGLVVYDRRLANSEVESFELIRIPEAGEDAALAQAIVAELDDYERGCLRELIAEKQYRYVEATIDDRVPRYVHFDIGHIARLVASLLERTP